MSAPVPVSYVLEDCQGRSTDIITHNWPNMCRRAVSHFSAGYFDAYHVRMSDGSLVIVRPKGKK